MGFRRSKVFYILLLLFALEWTILAISPLYRSDWLLENLLVLFLVPLLFYGHRSLPFSTPSYVMIFLFLALHEVGAHYTYSEVPYDRWFQSLSGFSLNEALGWERNHFDRLVHFLYGLLIAYPIREIFLYVANVRGFWGYFLPLDLTMSSSMFFELVEWVVAELVASDLGMAFLGAQGDIWDAHKDMALASLGALIAMLITAMINVRMQKDFSSEWANSLRVNRRLQREKLQRSEL